MIVYSKKIIQFLTDIKLIVKKVLSQELNLKVAGDRFYNREQTFSFPIKIVVFNNKSMLGYYDPNFFELGFNECLMFSSKEQLRNVIRHELAHYMIYILYGENVQHHGPEFKAFCSEVGWDQNVSQATLCLENEQHVIQLEENNVLRKVQKLMALASSSNQNEAEQAIIKSQQLLLKHNIESKYVGKDDEEKIYLKRIMKQKKENAKMRSIATILETFFVNIVYSRANNFIYLEILGTAVNIEIAEYVAGFLDCELEILWIQAQKEAKLKGVIAKNSFFLGVAKGYCNKIHFLKRNYDQDITNAMMVIEKKLQEAKNIIYPRLSQCKSSASYCSESSKHGELVGKQLSIKPGIKQSSNLGLFLLYTKN